MHPELTPGTGYIRAVVASLLFVTSLFACSGDFSLCKQKFIDAKALDGNRLTLPITETTDLVYSPTGAPSEAIKADPFLGLYLVKREQPFKHPYALTPVRAKAMAAVDSYMALPGVIRKEQSGLNTLAQFDQPLFAPCIINDPCCSIEGIVTHWGIVEKAYIRHFLNSDNPAYGDAGVRFKMSGKQLVIDSTDPFVVGNPFETGDRVVALDGQKINGLKELQERILLGGINRTCEFTLERYGKPLKVTTLVDKRYGGGRVSDTYLERRGYFFDQELYVIEDNGQVKIGDRLIRVNSRAVSSWEDVRQFLELGEEKAVLLFERKGFQFFVHLGFR